MTAALLNQSFAFLVGNPACPKCARKHSWTVSRAEGAPDVKSPTFYLIARWQRPCEKCGQPTSYRAARWKGAP
jgi:hypothetical protein